MSEDLRRLFACLLTDQFVFDVFHISHVSQLLLLLPLLLGPHGLSIYTHDLLLQLLLLLPLLLQGLVDDNQSEGKQTPVCVLHVTLSMYATLSMLLFFVLVHVVSAP